MCAPTFAGFPRHTDSQTTQRSFENADESGQKSTHPDAYFFARGLLRSYVAGFCVWLWLSQVSEMEMRGMLALEMELSVEEILVYRDVAG